MFLSRIRKCSDSVRKRAPWQCGHGVVFTNWLCHRETVFLRQRIQRPEQQCVLVFSENGDAAGFDGFVPVGNHLVDVDFRDDAQAVAIFACTVGRIEGEGVRFGFRVGNARGGAHQKLAVVLHLLGLVVEDHDGTLAVFHRDLHAVGEPLLRIIRHGEVIDRQLDIVDFVTIDLHAHDKGFHRAIDTHAGESLLADVLEQFAIMTLAPLHHRSEQRDGMTLVTLQNQVYELLFGIVDHLLLRVVGVGVGHAGVEQAQEVINLRDRAHRGTRVLVDGLLFDGNHRVEAGNLINVGMLHVADEMTGVRGVGLHIAALSLGVDGVKRQRRLATPAQSGDDHQLLLRDCQRHIFQIVLTRTRDNKRVLRLYVLHFFHDRFLILGRQRYNFFHSPSLAKPFAMIVRSLRT